MKVFNKQANIFL